LEKPRTHQIDRAFALLPITGASQSAARCIALGIAQEYSFFLPNNIMPLGAGNHYNMGAVL